MLLLASAAVCAVELVGTGAWGDRPGRTSLARLGVIENGRRLETLSALGSAAVLNEMMMLSAAHKKAFVDARPAAGTTRQVGDAAQVLLDAGGSRVVRREAAARLEDASPEVARVLAAATSLGNDVAAIFAAPTTLHAYVTGAYGSALETHTDPWDVLVLQLRGSKLWSLCEAAVVPNSTSPVWAMKPSITRWK